LVFGILWFERNLFFFALPREFSWCVEHMLNLQRYRRIHFHSRHQRPGPCIRNSEKCHWRWNIAVWRAWCKTV
jgi:hypothetical protein